LRSSTPVKVVYNSIILPDTDTKLLLRNQPNSTQIATMSY